MMTLQCGTVQWMAVTALHPDTLFNPCTVLLQPELCAIQAKISDKFEDGSPTAIQTATEFLQKHRQVDRTAAARAAECDSCACVCRSSMALKSTSTALVS